MYLLCLGNNACMADLVTALCLLLCLVKNSIPPIDKIFNFFFKFLIILLNGELNVVVGIC